MFNEQRRVPRVGRMIVRVRTTRRKPYSIAVKQCRMISSPRHMSWRRAHRDVGNRTNAGAEVDGK